MTISIISHPDCALHEMGEHHPESPARLSAIQDQLLSSGLDLVLQHHDAPLVTRKQLCRVHDPEYVEQIFHSAPEQGYVATGSGYLDESIHLTRSAACGRCSGAWC